MGVSVVGLMHDAWYGDFVNRKHHLMRLFAADARVGPCLYVEPPIDSGVLARMQRQLASMEPGSPLLSRERSPEPRVSEAASTLRAMRERLSWPRGAAGFLGTLVPDRLHLLAPVEGIERAAGAFAGLLRELSIEEYVLWVQSPGYADLALALRPLALVYDCTDDYAAIQPEAAGVIRERDGRLLARADLVTTVSRTLHQQKSAVRSGVHMLPNAVDPRHFDPGREHEVPADLAGIGGRAVVGYVGRMNYKLDVRLLDEVTDRRPDIVFVFIGPGFQRVAELQKRNTLFLGTRPYDDLPAYVARMDVCMIPHRLSDITMHMNPVKVYEYLAMGKPVVATNIRGLEDVGDEVVQASDADEFCAALDAALEGGTEADRARRRAVVLGGHTWTDRVEAVWRLLRTSPGGRPGPRPAGGAVGSGEAMPLRAAD